MGIATHDNFQIVGSCHTENSSSESNWIAIKSGWRVFANDSCHWRHLRQKEFGQQEGLGFQNN